MTAQSPTCSPARMHHKPDEEASQLWTVLSHGDDSRRRQQGDAQRQGGVGQAKPIEPQQSGGDGSIPESQEAQKNPQQRDRQAGDDKTADSPHGGTVGDDDAENEPNRAKDRERNQLRQGEFPENRGGAAAARRRRSCSPGGPWPRRSPRSTAARGAVPAGKGPVRPPVRATSSGAAEAGLPRGLPFREANLFPIAPSPTRSLPPPSPSRRRGRGTPTRPRAAATRGSSGRARTPPGRGTRKRRRSPWPRRRR